MTINEQIRSLCSRLRLYALPRLLESEAHLAQEQGKTHVEFLHDLLAREVQERDSKDFQRRLKAAALPARHDLDLFDHNYSQGITAPQTTRSAPTWMARAELQPDTYGTIGYRQDLHRRRPRI